MKVYKFFHFGFLLLLSKKPIKECFLEYFPTYRTYSFCLLLFYYAYHTWETPFNSYARSSICTIKVTPISLIITVHVFQKNLMIFTHIRTKEHKRDWSCEVCQPWRHDFIMRIHMNSTTPTDVGCNDLSQYLMSQPYFLIFHSPLIILRNMIT